jgi:hypothetical protein
MLLGDEAKPTQGIGMANARKGQPPLDEPAHSLPGDNPCLTTLRPRYGAEATRPEQNSTPPAHSPVKRFPPVLAKSRA